MRRGRPGGGQKSLYIGFVEDKEEANCQIEHVSKKAWADLLVENWLEQHVTTSAKAAARLTLISCYDLMESCTDERQFTVWVRRANSEQWRAFAVEYDPNPLVTAQEITSLRRLAEEKVGAA